MKYKLPIDDGLPSLRDMFASQAMHALITTGGALLDGNLTMVREQDADARILFLAAGAYKVSDAMLKARAAR